MSFSFLVADKVDDLPTDRQVIMVGGTVPGWKIQDNDFHWDRHTSKRVEIQIDELPVKQIIGWGCWGGFHVMSNACFVTTEVNAENSAAFAAIVLLEKNKVKLLESALPKLRAISQEAASPGSCQEELRVFAAKAVKALDSLKSTYSNVRHSVKCFSTISSVQQKQENHR